MVHAEFEASEATRRAATIYAKGDWQATGVYGQESHDRSTVMEVDGEWRYGTGRCGPKGAGTGDRNRSPSGARNYPWAGAGALTGMLVGRWGEGGGAFPIGSPTAVRGGSGEGSRQLCLRMNDHKDGYGDNDGEIAVVIDASDRTKMGRCTGGTGSHSVGNASEPTTAVGEAACVPSQDADGPTSKTFRARDR